MYPYTSCNGSSDIFAAEKTDSISPDRERLLSLIDTAIDFKQRAADKYFFILDEIKDDDDREIVRSIYIDEIRGKKLLESIKEDINQPRCWSEPSKYISIS